MTNPSGTTSKTWVLFWHPNLTSRHQTWVSNPDRSQIAQWTFTRMAKASASKAQVSKASASKSQAVRKVFPKPKPGVKRFSGGRIRRWRIFQWQNPGVGGFLVFAEDKPVVSADKTSVGSADETSGVSADKTSAAAAAKTPAVSQDISRALWTMRWECFGRPQMSSLLPQQMSCVLTQQMLSLIHI